MKSRIIRTMMFLLVFGMIAGTSVTSLQAKQEKASAEYPYGNMDDNGAVLNYLSDGSPSSLTVGISIGNNDVVTPVITISGDNAVIIKDSFVYEDKNGDNVASTDEQVAFKYYITDKLLSQYDSSDKSWLEELLCDPINSADGSIPASTCLYVNAAGNVNITVENTKMRDIRVGSAKDANVFVAKRSNVSEIIFEKTSGNAKATIKDSVVHNVYVGEDGVVEGNYEVSLEDKATICKPIFSMGTVLGNTDITLDNVKFENKCKNSYDNHKVNYSDWMGLGDESNITAVYKAGAEGKPVKVTLNVLNCDDLDSLFVTRSYDFNESINKGEKNTIYGDLFCNIRNSSMKNEWGYSNAGIYLVAPNSRNASTVTGDAKIMLENVTLNGTVALTDYVGNGDSIDKNHDIVKGSATIDFVGNNYIKGNVISSYFAVNDKVNGKNTVNIVEGGTTVVDLAVDVSDLNIQKDAKLGLKQDLDVYGKLSGQGSILADVDARIDDEATLYSSLCKLVAEQKADIDVLLAKFEGAKYTLVEGEKNSSKISKIKLSAASGKIAAGKKIRLEAVISPASAADNSLAWSSSNNKYATVDAKGTVTTKKAGAGKKVVITATAKDGSGKKATYTINIVKDAVKSIKISGKKSVKAGKSIKLKANVNASGKTANKTVTWTTSNDKYASVNSKGKVTTKKAGAGKTVKITATANDGTGKKATIKIFIIM